MSKPIVSQDTEIMQVEQMVYDALTEINESMTNVAECQHMGSLYDMVMSGFTVYDDDVVTVEMVKRIREEWVSDMTEVAELTTEDTTADNDGIRCGECGADVSDTEDGWCDCLDVATTDDHSMRRTSSGDDVAEAVSAAIEEMQTMSNAELQVLSVQWVVMASWDDMSQAMSKAYAQELQNRLAKQFAGDDYGKPISSVADLRAYLA